MFDIAFLDHEPELQQGGTRALRGRIVLGDFQEEFLAALVTWDRAAYERHWVDAACRIVAHGHERTGFFASAFQFFWIMWREGEEMLVRQKLLVEDTVLEPFDPADPYRQIEDYSHRGPDNAPVSEWRIAVTDLRAFLARRGASCRAAERRPESP